MTIRGIKSWKVYKVFRILSLIRLIFIEIRKQILNKLSLNLNYKMSKVLVLISLLLVSTVKFGSGQNALIRDSVAQINCPSGKPCDDIS